MPTYQQLKETDPEKFELLKQRNRERSKAWREQNPDRSKSYMKAYQEHYRSNEQNMTRIRDRANMWRKDNIKRAMLGRAKRRAEKLGIAFDLTEHDIDIPALCPIYGIHLNPYAEGPNNPNTPSLDRIDNTKGYIRGNVHVISQRANKHKNDATKAEILMLAEWASKAL